MNVFLNTNCFTLCTDDRNILHLDLTEEFEQIANALQTVMDKWNEVQTRNTAVLQAKYTAAKKCLAMSETLETVCKKALENGYIPTR